MYKLLIVDDEPIVRLGFKSLVNWEENNIEVSFEASNGQQALEILKKNSDIDLVVTDINMPIMDGLQLIENIKSLEIDPSIVVLSAYDDYELVRRAFKLGVRDYIIKYKMNPQNTLSIIKKILSTINKKESNNKTFYQFKRARRNFLRNVVMGISQADLEETAKELKIEIEDRDIVICSMVIDNYTNLKKRYIDGDLNSALKSIKNSVDQVMIEGNEIIAISPEEFILFLTLNCYSRPTIEEQLSSIRQSLNNYLNIDVTIGISPPCKELNDLFQLFKISQKNVNLRFILGKGKNIFPEDSSSVYQTSSVPLQPMVKELFQYFDKMNSEATNKQLDKILSLIEHFQAENITELLYEYSKLIILFNNHIIDYDPGADIYIDANAYNKLKEFETTNEVHSWIKEYVLGIFKDINNRKQRISPIIKEARIYIEKNFMDKNILDSMCKNLQINKSYFSTLFSQEINISFSNYLNQIRVKQAKELLSTTNLRVYELCEEVGYSNTEHFSRVFKKETGFSPSQYRATYYKE